MCSPTVSISEETQPVDSTCPFLPLRSPVDAPILPGCVLGRPDPPKRFLAPFPGQQSTSSPMLVSPVRIVRGGLGVSRSSVAREDSPGIPKPKSSGSRPSAGSRACARPDPNPRPEVSVANEDQSRIWIYIDLEENQISYERVASRVPLVQGCENLEEDRGTSCLERFRREVPRSELPIDRTSLPR